MLSDRCERVERISNGMKKNQLSFVYIRMRERALTYSQHANSIQCELNLRCKYTICTIITVQWALVRTSLSLFARLFIRSFVRSFICSFGSRWMLHCLQTPSPYDSCDVTPQNKTNKCNLPRPNHLKFVQLDGALEPIPFTFNFSKQITFELVTYRCNW